ncbi:adenosine kinase [Estrella lausannensis]|uniref:Carbohydrate kinase n=1 Tax=Estrella lausannensis TaxID=483423 RepID=A0A0H5DRR6_9BACT|nr:adenosine kinase [Estrella lausannensis]CRX38409.1 Carbohydrate kinase [Estrella lausannensis]
MAGGKVLGIGAAVLDHTLFATDDLLSEIHVFKGSAGPASQEKLRYILAKGKIAKPPAAGGSAANTIRGLAMLEQPCAFFGKAGNDQAGEIFRQSLANAQIDSFMVTSPLPTTEVACLITEDGEKTMFYHLGASTDIKPDEITQALFQNTRIVHIEGYTFLQEGVPERAAELAREAGCLVSLDLGSFTLVRQKKGRMADFIIRYCDIVFANADEAFALTGQPPKEACLLMKDLSETAVVLFGEGGAWVGKGYDLMHGPSLPARAVDTTGAGDLFIAGFLYGVLQGFSLERCALNGNLLASEVIGHLGSEIPHERWPSLKARIKG